GELKRLVAAGNSPPANGHRDVAHGKHFVVLGTNISGCRFARPAKDGANSGDQLARIEGLGQVVVSADFKAQNAVNRFSSGGQQEHGDRRLSANGLEQLESRAARQHHVKDNQFVVTSQGRGQSRRVVVGGVHLEAFAFEKASEKIDQGVVIIHDEQTVHGIYFALSRANWR